MDLVLWRILPSVFSFNEFDDVLVVEYSDKTVVIFANVGEFDNH